MRSERHPAFGLVASPRSCGSPCEKIEWQDNPSGGRFGPRSETGRRRYRYRGKSRSSPARKPRAVERLLGPEPVIRTRRRRCCSVRCSCLRAAPRLRRSQGARRAGRPPARAVSTIFRQQGGVSDRGAYAAGHITDLSAAYVVLKDFLSNATEERGRKQWELQSGGVEPRTPRGERTWMIYEAEGGTVVAKKLDEI